MGILTFDEAREYEHGSNLFNLENNHDTAIIKILVASSSNILQYMVHEVKYQGNRKRVLCSKDKPTSGDDQCVLCSSGKKFMKKYYIPVYNFTEGKFQFWERGPSFRSKITSLNSNFYPIHDFIFEVERVGEKGDQDTKYNFVEMTEEYINSIRDEEEAEFAAKLSLPSDVDAPDILTADADILIIKTPEELEYYATHDKFEDDTFDYDEHKEDRKTDSSSRFARDRADTPNQFSRDRGNRDSRDSSQSVAYSTRNRSSDVGQGYQSRARSNRAF